jgi:hypothetical protein
MLDSPAPVMEFPGDPSTVTFPREFFGAYYYDCAYSRYFFQFIYTKLELICLSVSAVSALTQAA